MAGEDTRELLKNILDTAKETRVEVGHVREDQADFNIRLSKTEQSAADHRAEKSIHQTPPCDYTKGVDEKVQGIERKVFAGLVLSLVSVIGLLVSIIGWIWISNHP